MKLTNEQLAEFVKCKRNILYFIYNYVYIPEIGGILKYSKDIMNKKILQTIKSIINHHYAILMASRQLGKSTIAAILLEWALNFYPGNRAIILNMEKKYALENLERVKFIHESLPDFLKVPLKYKGERKTYMEYLNGSKLEIFYPSTTAKPETVARSLTVPILYIDEAAYIRHISEIYTSAQQTLSRAIEQAKKNNMPYFIFITSTPNGTYGDGEWFYKMWSNAIDSEEIFSEDNSLIIKDHDELVSRFPDKNGFIRIKYHWSEDQSKDHKWYENQKRLMNFDKRRINQELDLMFLGSDRCIFSDDVISELRPVKPIKRIKLIHDYYLKQFKKLDPNDYYVIGIDSAKSVTGDMCALEIFNYSNFEQVAELSGRFGSITLYIEVIEKVIEWLMKEVGRRFYLAIENNSFGNQIVEYFENEYGDLIFSPDEKYLGINTNSKTKKLMISLIYDKISNDPSIIKSSDLIFQLNVIERKPNGSISSKSGHYDDLFMASAFCAYCYEFTYEDVLPMMEKNYDKIKSKEEDNIVKAIAITPTKEEVRIDPKDVPDFDDYITDEDNEIYLPIFIR
ncbi:MAG: terminase family protein [Candidatus Anstonellales archaeon]